MILRIILSALIKLLLLIPIILGLFLVPIGLRRGFTGWLWPWGNDDHPDNGGVFAIKNNISPYSWFALRNPIFNLGKYILGFKSQGKSVYINGSSDRNIGDTKAEGWYYARERWAWEVCYIKAYNLFGMRKCLRIRIGWKILGKPPGELCQICFVVSPIHSYTGA